MKIVDLFLAKLSLRTRLGLCVLLVGSSVSHSHLPEHPAYEDSDAISHNHSAQGEQPNFVCGCLGQDDAEEDNGDDIDDMPDELDWFWGIALTCVLLGCSR